MLYNNVYNFSWDFTLKLVSLKLVLRRKNGLFYKNVQAEIDLKFKNIPQAKSQFRKDVFILKICFLK